jgi:CDP-diacylglycerol---glycerol-3-phosphate 3-phosphatidyltransferase
VLNQTNARSVVGKVLDPVAASLLRLGLTPDMVTLIGTVGVSLAAIIFFPRGQFVVGVLVIVLFIFSDMIDGAMARQQKRTGPWGAFLDSTLDRVADGFVFGALLIWAVRTQSNATIVAALICLVGGFVISYAKARAEGLGMTCNVGVAERTERLIIALVAAFIYGLGVAYVLPAGLWVLAALTLLTIAQRFAVVHRQARRLVEADTDSENDAEPQSSDEVGGSPPRSTGDTGQDGDRND